MALTAKVELNVRGKWVFISTTESPLFLSGIDKKTLSKVEEEFEILKKLSLDEGLTTLFLKEDPSNGSPSSRGCTVLEEAIPEGERRVSFERPDPFELASDSPGVDSAKVRRKGIPLGSRRGARSRVGSVSRRSLRENTQRNAKKSRGNIAAALRSRSIKKRR
jgi:hypothetical protein